jgi:hypothetical protein
MSAMLRSVAEGLANRHDVTASPIYPTEEDRNAEYKKGDHAVVVALLSGAPVVEEDRLEWGQVREFRADEIARGAYWEFVDWLDEEMAGQTSGSIAERIEGKLAGYENALEKHGIATALGGISALLSGIGVPVILEKIRTQPWWLLAAEGILAGGSILAKVAADHIQSKPVAPREMAWVYSLSRLTD